jgi:hypothetical protein
MIVLVDARAAVQCAASVDLSSSSVSSTICWYSSIIGFSTNAAAVQLSDSEVLTQSVHRMLYVCSDDAALAAIIVERSFCEVRGL